MPGDLFSKIYLRPESALADCPKFRTRLWGYYSSNHSKSETAFVQRLMTDAGVGVPAISMGNFASWNLYSFFTQSPIEDVLDGITVLWRVLDGEQIDSNPAHPWLGADARNWAKFVSSVFQEEAMGYVLDKKAVVHYHVDKEFERNQVSALSGLGASRYKAVRAAFDSGFKKLDRAPADVKGGSRLCKRGGELYSIPNRT